MTHTHGMLSACKVSDCADCAGDVTKYLHGVLTLVHCICECHREPECCIEARGETTPDGVAKSEMDKVREHLVIRDGDTFERCPDCNSFYLARFLKKKFEDICQEGIICPVCDIRKLEAEIRKLKEAAPEGGAKSEEIIVPRCKRCNHLPLSHGDPNCGETCSWGDCDCPRFIPPDKVKLEGDTRP